MRTKATFTGEPDHPRPAAPAPVGAVLPPGAEARDCHEGLRGCKARRDALLAEAAGADTDRIRHLPALSDVRRRASFLPVGEPEPDRLVHRKAGDLVGRDEPDDLLNERRRQQRGEVRRLRLAAHGASRGHGAAVGTWGWGEVRALRQSLRLTVRAFAAHIGVSVATVCHWEHRERVTRLHLATEETLDRALKIADEDARARFLELRDHYQMRRDGLGEER